MTKNLYLVEFRSRYWTVEPEGTSYDYDYGFCVDDENLVPGWVRPFIEEEGESRFIDDQNEKFLDVAQEEIVPWTGGLNYVLEEWTAEIAFSSKDVAQRYLDAIPQGSPVLGRVTRLLCSNELSDRLSREG